ncbi:DUF2937 family protein [Phaeobacter sp. B1627]|uniref:DUF2937 family protein n=1 Tax=Phaeobacter sp. B1627 TaxID=2583809 RepID=UPI0011180B97|nr:DUF2937 family protein [Phaeobacter sp. B1627]TNJ48210.1 DUF2937 family protein [Phaeobacter sp. B1627]
MMSRVIPLLGGLCAGAGLSQFPAYAQAYLQRLGGHVDALRRTVAEFDADAAALGLERHSALVQLARSGEIGAQRAETMAATIDRYERLAADLHELAALAPVDRALHLRRFAETDIAAATLGAFEPALPVSADALLLMAAGGILGAGGLRGLGALLGLLRRRSARMRQRRNRLA